ncbi:hypothetical protein SAMN02746065_10393 [Desulfocicer vacuolatum DSM 3385]|uniref:Beta-barrel porin 2 n=1 Tax=Desulfocicer vacuolatum DSM 3385 TaxID=1121400 RepID=A0A1W1ZPN8_9BACT|nr:hypothetical protein [Desulfocicer vacuolatum]SMC50515.1 hypothetical protein SAMN02746065_10393 [Desulfocicer vacuolatum DSM 3385]
MNISRSVNLFLICLLTGSLLFFANIKMAVGALKTVFYPILYVSGHYTDNADQSEFNKNEEYYTTYGTALSLRFIQENSTVTVTYNPEYNDRSSIDDEENSLEHNASLQAHVQASRRVVMDMSFNYDGHDRDVLNESWEHTGRFSTTLYITDKTSVVMGGTYADAYERRQLTGEYREHTDYGGSVNVVHRFSQNNQIGLYLNYSNVDYEPPVLDDYQEYSAASSLGYWFSNQWGMDSTVEYETTQYDFQDSDVDTWTANLRLLRRLSPRFLSYIKYEHIYSQRELNDVNMYIPSMGVEWDVSEDMGVSLGAGYIFQEWGTENDGRFFADVNVFKGVDLSRHARILFTAASGIDPTSDDSAELGFQIYYQAGFLFTWQMQQHLAATLRGAYVRDEFIEPVVDRIDTSWQGGAGLTWSPWAWGDIVFSYGYENFTTDSSLRDDFQEHRGTVTIQVHPTYEMGGQREDLTRNELQQRIYND